MSSARAAARAPGAPTEVPQSPSATAIGLAVWRHGLPLVPLYLRHGSIPSYLVLTAFDLALGLMLIVGTTRERSDPTTVDPRATWLVSRLTAVVVMAIFLGAVAAVLTVPIGMSAFIFGWSTGVEWPALVQEPSFMVSVVAMALTAGAQAQHRFEAVTTPGAIGTAPQAAPIIGDLDGDRRRSQGMYAAHVTLIATYVALSYTLSTFGRWGSFVFPVVYSAMLIGYDVRPDLAQQILPDLWRRTRA
ncbi:MAG: hypothetical protein ABIR79_16470 [Candidatus Binatia bacterium]